MEEYISFHYDPADKVHSGAKKLAEHLFIPMGKVNEEYIRTTFSSFEYLMKKLYFSRRRGGGDGYE